MQEKGYKTKQRSLILKSLKDNCENALTVDEINEKMKSCGCSVGKTTVYRYVDKLVKSGQVRKFVSENGKSATFQYIENNDSCNEHIHLKCVDCGRFIHLDCTHMESVNRHIYEEHKFMVDNSKSLLFGLCEHCLKESNHVTD